MVITLLIKYSSLFRSEFIDRFEHFKHLMRLVELQSEPYKATSQSIIELVNFLGSVVFCYKGQVYYIFFFRYLVVIYTQIFEGDEKPKGVCYFVCYLL